MRKVIVLCALVFSTASLVAQDEMTRKLTINKSDEGFTFYCKAKLEGLSNIDTIDAIKTDFGKNITRWKYDATTGRVLIPSAAFGGITGFFQLKFIVGAAVISQQLYSKASTFLVDTDDSYPEVGTITSVKFCGKILARYHRWGKNGIIVNEFDLSTVCKDVIDIEITYTAK